ncbi:MAG: hypothetical protein LBM62_08135 [Mediterranea sp.]|jgi:hypothetical protein|nr:hypothetical protein [Mediterranea sp.]
MISQVKYWLLLLFAALLYEGLVATNMPCTFPESDTTCCFISQETSNEQAVSDLYQHVSSLSMYVDNVNLTGKKMASLLSACRTMIFPPHQPNKKASLPVTQELNVHDEAYFVFGLRKIVV